MPKTRISEWSSTPANNTDIDSINIAEGCAPSGINDAIRELMSQVKDLYAGTSGDIIAVAAGGTGVGTSTGSGNNVLSTSPTLVTPALGTPSALVGTNITGTAANFNINGTVGATTANTGAFTTLAASSTVTFSGGTANGVTYLNGSKVLTSGSALTFDGTNLSVGTASPSGKLQVQATNSGIYFDVTNAYTPKIIASGALSDLQIEAVGNGGTLINKIASGTSAFIWNQGSGELMKLNSTGLGIGTSSPVAKLDVYQATAGTAALKVLHVNGNGITVNPSYNYYDAFTHYFRSLSGTTTYATIDNSGNLGLGVTPSAWQSTTKSIDISSGGAIYAGSVNIGLIANGYYNAAGTAIYKSSTFANSYTPNFANNGSHVWYNAPSGTAGNPISFTQAMTLNASGGLQTLNTVGVGNATPSTSGAGITFPATQSASSNANTLDDYEEGTWTPSLTGTATYSIQAGNYIKVGNLVTITFRIGVTLIGTGSATTISGLPFNVTSAIGGGSLAGSVGYWVSAATSISSCQLSLASTSTLNLNFTTGNQANSTYGGTFFGNGTVMWATATYVTT